VNPGFDGTLSPWSYSGYQVPPLDCSIPSNCSAYLGGFNNAGVFLRQQVLVPEWAENAAIYFDWAMVSVDSVSESHDYLEVAAIDWSTGLPDAISSYFVHNTRPRGVWYRQRLPILTIQAYRGEVITVQAFAHTDEIYPTGWYVDNFMIYFACGSWVAGEAETSGSGLSLDREVP
jgi:hypothetical protein